MTREEAIKWLDKLYTRADITDEYGDMEDMQPYEEALDMAVKALEQEPSKDTISRKKLIKDLNFLYNEDGHIKDLSAKRTMEVIMEQSPVNPQESILDEIREEIEQGYREVNNDYDQGRNCGLYIATQIIDKCKESEE